MAPGAVLCLFTVAAFVNSYECKMALDKFSKEDVFQLNEVDLAIARLRLVPYYRYLCPASDDKWDVVERRLEKHRTQLERRAENQ